MASTTPEHEGSILFPSNLLEGSCGCSIDIGGSLIKVVVVDKIQNQAPGLTKLRLATFSPCDLSGALSYILDHRAGTGGSTTITTTGVGVRGQVTQEIEERLQLKVENTTETPPMFTAFFDLAQTRPFAEVVAPVADDIQKSSRDFLTRMEAVHDMLTQAAEDWTDEYARMVAQQSGIPSAPPVPPCVIHSEHAGVKSKMEDAAELKDKADDVAEPDVPLLLHIYGRAENAGGNGRAGKTLLGLASLLLGIADYNELMELASRGTDSTLSLYSRDLKPPRPPGQPRDDYDVWPDDLRIFSFGKAVGKDLANQKREGVARALVSHVCDDLAMTYHLACRAHACRALFICGGLVEHQLIRDTLWSSFNGMNVPDKVEMYFLKQGWFYPAIGCLRTNAYRNQTKK